MAQINNSGTRNKPVIQASSRGLRKADVNITRTKCAPASTINACAAKWCTPRRKEPAASRSMKCTLAHAVESDGLYVVISSNPVAT